MNRISIDYNLLNDLDLDSITELRAASHEGLSHEQIVNQLRKALSEPIDFPSLSQATVPGDRVVIVIAEDVPQLGSIAEGALAALQDAGVERELVTLVLPNRMEEEQGLVQELVSRGLEQNQIEFHKPEDEDAIAMFGVSNSGEALRLNRTICDADLVVSVGSPAANTKPTFNGLYPEFSDSQTINRVGASGFDQEGDEASRQEVIEAGWMLGVGFVVQVVPAPEGGVAAILAGEPKEVARLGQKQYAQHWGCEVSDNFDLVIASIGNEVGQQTWDNLARALGSAAQLLRPNGTIVLCSGVSELPGEALHCLVDCDDYQIARREIQKHKLPGSFIAWKFSEALESGAVNLISQLPDSYVESLGVTPIMAIQEIERLVENHESAAILHEAHRILPSLS